MPAIGIDTHKRTLAACAVDDVGTVIAERTFDCDRAGFGALAVWAAAVAPGATIGIEGSSSYGAPLAHHLVAAGHTVREVPPQLSRRERGRGRRAGKSDPGDALAIARVTVREPDLPPVRLEDRSTELGLLMGTRAGSIDPGILLALLRDRRASVAELEDVLDHRSGLLGVSGRSSDVRELLVADAAGDDAAALALELFVRRAAAGIAAAATCLPSVDAIVFTGGIGENSAVIRARIAGRLEILGVPPIPTVDVAEDRVLVTASGVPAVLRIESREDIVIAEAVRSVLL